MTFILPAMPLHELTHAAVGRLAGADVRMGFDEVGAYAEMQWTPDTPILWARLTHLAPTIVGLFLGALVGAVTFFAFEPVQALGFVAADLLRLIASFWLAVNWFVYAYPGPADRNPFAGP